MKVLTLCGSPRAHSSNRAILQAYEQVATDLSFTAFDRLGELPHFNPDMDRDGVPLPTEVVLLRQRVAQADALVISTPEYIHALPGALKNALEWLVSDPAFIGKPVAILQAARGSTWALDSLHEVLTTMSARIVEPASVSLPLRSNRVDADAILAREELRALLVRSAAALREALGQRSASAP